MDVVELLNAHADEIVATATWSMARARLRHYEADGALATSQRLRTLLDLVLLCARDRHLEPILEYAERMARDRHEAQFELSEVQTAINVLEEAVWTTIVRDMPAAEQGTALGLVSTVLGAAKDRLASTYVTLVSHRRTASIDQEALFRGTDALPAQHSS